MSSRFRPCLPLLLVAATPGCCNFARWLCGPDRSEWLDPGFDTPALALRTFQEAIRREDALWLHRSLSEGLKARTGLVGPVEVGVALSELSGSGVPAHMLGYAEVESERALGDGRVEVVLALAGRRVVLELVRQGYWELVMADPEAADGLREDGSNTVAVRRLVEIDPDGDFGSIVRFTTPETDLDVEDPARITRLAVGHEWKIDAFAAVAPDRDSEPAVCQ